MICQHEQESHPDSAKLQTLTPQGITSSNDSSKTIREEEKELYDEGNGGGTVHEDPTSAAATQQRWNHPRKNMWRTYVCFLMLFSMGLNDGAVGVSTCKLSRHSQLIGSTGIDPIRTCLIFYTCNTFDSPKLLAPTLLPPILHHCLSRIPGTWSWLHYRCASQQPHSHGIWSAWHSLCCSWRTLCCLYNKLSAPSFPCPGNINDPCWLWCWPGRRSLECLAGRYAKCK